MVQLAALILGNLDAAHDAVAEAFARAYPKYQHGTITNVRAYLQRAVVHETTSTFRKRTRQRRLNARLTPKVDVPSPEQHIVDFDEMDIALRSHRSRQNMAAAFHTSLSRLGRAATVGARTRSGMYPRHSAVELFDGCGAQARSAF